MSELIPPPLELGGCGGGDPRISQGSLAGELGRRLSSALSGRLRAHPRPALPGLHLMPARRGPSRSARSAVGTGPGPGWRARRRRRAAGLASSTLGLAWLGDALSYPGLESGLQYIHIVRAIHIGALLQPPWGKKPASGWPRACNQWILEKNCGTSDVLSCVRRHGGGKRRGRATGAGTPGLGSCPELRNLSANLGEVPWKQCRTS